MHADDGCIVLHAPEDFFNLTLKVVAPVYSSATVTVFGVAG